MAKNQRYIVGLDIGTTQIVCVIGEAHEDGGVHLVGVGSAPSRGLRKGVVVNLDATVEAIKRSVQEAELMAGVSVDTASVGIGGGHIRSFQSRGVIAISSRDRIVSDNDMKRVLDSTRAVAIPQDREIVHVLPQEFVLDNQGGINDPRGMTGARLEVNVHIVTAASTSVQNLVTCVNRAGIEVREIVLEQLAAAESVLTEDEKELGAVLLDLGGGTTAMSIFERGSIGYTSVLPVGGDHFTNDLAVGLRAPIPEAERLKKQHGCALASMVLDEGTIEVPSVGGRKPRQLSLKLLSEILQPRAEEIFQLLSEEIRRAGFERQLNAGVVLSGGASQLPGMIEVAEQVFDLPVRVGSAIGVGGLVAPMAGPDFATGIGLVLHGAHQAPSQASRIFTVDAGVVGRSVGRVRNWFAEMF